MKLDRSLEQVWQVLTLMIVASLSGAVIVGITLALQPKFATNSTSISVMQRVQP